MASRKDFAMADLEDALAEGARPEPVSVTAETTPAQEIIPPQDFLLDVVVKPAAPFDYSQFDPKHRITLQGHHARIYKKTKRFVFDVGEELLQARDLLRQHYPGTWGKWRDSTFAMSKSSIHNIMSATEWYRKCPTVGQLELKALYAGTHAPAEVQAEIVRKIETADIPSFDEVEAMKRAHKTRQLEKAGQEEVVARSAASSRQDDESVSINAAAMTENFGEDAVDSIATSGQVDASTDTADRAYVDSAKPHVNEIGDNINRAAAINEMTRAASARTAAIELIARLREYVDEDQVIVELVELWHTTTFADVQLVLKASVGE